MSEDTTQIAATLYSALKILMEEIDKLPAKSFTGNGQEEFYKFLATTRMVREVIKDMEGPTNE